ncbi:MAG: Rid family detoxifying hydrolase [Planctomycetota bacterium]
MTDLVRIATDAAPAAIGPYSQAVRAGDWILCSGQIALDPASGELVGEDAAAQARRALENLEAVLRAAGSSLGRVARTTVYLRTMDDFPSVNEVYATFFRGPTLPARATVAAAGLPKGALVEIDCMALAD